MIRNGGYKKSSEFAIKRSFNLLAKRECGGHVATSIILQIGALEYVKKAFFFR